MLRRVHQISTYLAITLGVVHLCFTPFAYQVFTHNTLWFFGAGMAIVYAGFLNLAHLAHPAANTLRVLCLIASVLTGLMFAIALSVVPEPQVFVGLTLFAACAAATFIHRTKD